MTLSIIEGTRFEQMEQIADLQMEGLNETQIAKKLDIKRKDVIVLLEDYRNILRNDQEARDLARDHLVQMVKHYDKLIKKFYDLLDDLQAINFNHQVAAQINSAIKNIAELEAKRLDALQKAGLLESTELGDELASMEEKQAILIDILRNDLCEHCKPKIAHKLAQVTGHVEVISSEVIDA